jgi:hypothetical protein
MNQIDQQENNLRRQMDRLPARLLHFLGVCAVMLLLQGLKCLAQPGSRFKVKGNNQDIAFSLDKKWMATRLQDRDSENILKLWEWPSLNLLKTISLGQGNCHGHGPVARQHFLSRR